jgi:AcrR family transcriptional regulator
MSDSVKSGQATTGGREQARTRLARGAVVVAARALFLETGYAATTIGEISDRAGVPQATVYRLFASKIGILKALLDASIAGDDEPVAVSARPEISSLHAATDPVELLTGFAGVTAAINRRTSDVHRILVGAAGSDAGAAELLGEIRQQRSQGQGQIAAALARRGALRAGLPEEEAADIIHALMSPEVYRLLVVDRSWSSEDYETWLAATLTQQLL